MTDESNYVEVKRILWHKKRQQFCLEFEDGTRRYPCKIGFGFELYLSDEEFKEEINKLKKKKKWWHIL